MLRILAPIQSFRTLFEQFETLRIASTQCTRSLSRILLNSIHSFRIRHGVTLSQTTYAPDPLTSPSQLDRLVGLAMLIVATAVFLYYTTWTLLMVGLVSQCKFSSLLIYFTSISLPFLQKRLLIISTLSPSSTKVTLSMTSFRPASGQSAYQSFSSFWLRQ